MKKIISLIKASMTDNMSLFKIYKKNQTKTSKKLLPLFLFFAVFVSIWSYANMIMEPLLTVNLEFVLLTLFVIITAFLTLIEGVYKSSNLLFNCKDDDLLLSLPIKKSTVLFIRILKFYVFELMYNSLFLLPAIVVYVRYVSVGISFYISSLVAILLLPIIPIAISCVVGSALALFSSNFKLKNVVQTVLTIALITGIMFVSGNIQNFIMKLAEKASSINEIITKAYYPAGAYAELVTNFNIQNLLTFIVVNLSIFIVTVFFLSKIYFKINSNVKAIKIVKQKKDYKIKARTPIKALMKKEFGRFISSPVFIVNAGYGLILFVAGSILAAVKLRSFPTSIDVEGITISMDIIKQYISIGTFAFVCFTSLLTSITSSMISLEGKSFNILKSLPLNPYTILKAKVLTAISIMVPFLLAGDLILFFTFDYSILEMILIIIASVILPLFAETIGILMNLKYPKMDAANDTEVVKQSMSSMVSVLAGMFLAALTGYGIFKLIQANIAADIIIIEILGAYTIAYLLISVYLRKTSEKYFNEINVN